MGTEERSLPVEANLVEANLWAMHRDFARIPRAEVHEDPEPLWFTAPSRNSWLGEVSPGMALEIASVERPPSPSRLVVAPVRTQDDLRDWLLAFDLGMEIDPPRGAGHPWLTRRRRRTGAMATARR